MPHAGSGLAADAHLDHLVVRPERAVHEENIRAIDPSAKRRRHPGAIGEIDDPAAAGLDLEPERVTGRGRRVEQRSGRGLGIERHLARCQKRPEPKAEPAALPIGRLEGLVRQHGPPLDQRRIEHAEDRVRLQRCQHIGVGIEPERRALAQMQEPHHRIDIGIGEHHRVDRARAQAVPRPEHPVGLDLLAQVRRSVDQEPTPTVAAERDRGLGRRGRHGIARPGPQAGRMTGVPLRKAAARGSPQHHETHDAPVRVTGGATGAGSSIRDRRAGTS